MDLFIDVVGRDPDLDALSQALGVPVDCITYDEHTKKISVIGNHPITVLQLHRRLADLWDAGERMHLSTASTRCTDHIVEMENGWEITEESMKLLKEGSLKQNGAWYSSHIDWPEPEQHDA